MPHPIMSEAWPRYLLLAMIGLALAWWEPNSVARESAIEIPNGAQAQRDWASADGKVLPATLLQLDGQTARLRRTDNQVVEIPFDLFSKKDQRELLRQRFLHGYTTRPLPTGTAIDLLPKDLDAEALEKSTYLYYRIADRWWSVRLHLAHGQPSLPPFSQIEIRVDLIEKTTFPAPDNQVFPRETDQPQPFDLQLTKQASQELLDRVDDQKSINMLVGLEPDWQIVDLSEDEIARFRDFFRWHRHLVAMDPAKEAADRSWLTLSAFGMKGLAAEPVPIEERGVEQTWVNVLGQQSVVTPVGIERDQVIFSHDGDQKKTALANFSLETREQIAQLRLDRGYYSWVEDNGSREFFQAQGESSGARDSFTHFVLGIPRSKPPGSLGLWFYVATSNPEMDKADHLSYLIDGDDEGKQFADDTSTAYDRTYRGKRWLNHLFGIRRSEALLKEFREMKSLRLILKKGDESILLDLTPKELRDLQDGFYLYQELTQVRDLRKKAGQ